MQSTTSDQWLRKWQVILSSTGSALGTETKGAAGQVTIPATQGPPASPNNSKVLSQDTQGYDLRVKFDVHQASVQTPNYAEITIFNLADSTAANVIKEFDFVTLEVGYQNGKFGTIFSGTIKIFERGHESAVDSFLRIFAADGDKPLNYATINEVLPAGSTPQNQLDKISKSFQDQGATKGYVDPQALIIPPTIRDSVNFGMTADVMRQFGAQNGAVWTITDGKLTFAGSTSYDPGDIVTLTGRTGLIFWPTVTPSGIEITALINPAVRLRQRLKLDNKSINQYQTPGGGPVIGVNFPGYDPQSFAQTSLDGTYCALVIDYSGDSRGNEWYMHITALAVDSTLDQQGAVPAGESQSLPAFPRAGDAASFAAGRS